MRHFQFIVSFKILFIISTFIYKCEAQEIFDENSFLIKKYFHVSKKTIPNTRNLENWFIPNYNYNNIALIQKGNNNEIEIKKKSKGSQTITQLGTNNYYSFINYYNNQKINFKIQQQGNSNSLHIYGENNLINNISIIQKSNFKTLIIKNY